MKNISLMLLACLFAFSVNAQEEPLTGKKGQPILPEASDIGLGVNLIPLFNWFGNSFNNTSNNTYAGSNKLFNKFGNSVIMGKYMLTDKTAVRVNFGFNFNGYTDNQFVSDDASNDPNAKVIDTRVQEVGRYVLGLGYEMRRGTGRIQGYYGADLGLVLNQTNADKYTYGNGYSTTNVVPTSHNWGGNLSSNERTISNSGTTQFGVGLRPFVGVEYFVAPKLSIGGEFGYNLMYTSTFESTSVTEYYEVSTGNVVNKEVNVASKGNFSGGVDNFNGAIFMMLYF